MSVFDWFVGTRQIVKALVGDTASIIFRTGTSGRAEIGLLGNDSFTLKTSSDGSVWETLLIATTSLLSTTKKWLITHIGGDAIQIQAPAGNVRGMSVLTDSFTRWTWGASATAESGGNAGSDWFLNRFNDAGSFVDTPILVNRATGQVVAPLVKSATQTIIPFGTPASASATGVQGEIKGDASFLYFCTATDTWKRVAIATW